MILLVNMGSTVFCQSLADYVTVSQCLFFILLQGILLDILVALGIIKSNHFWLDVEHLQEALQNVLVIVEMVFFSLLMQYAYSAEPYRTGSVAEKSDKKNEWLKELRSWCILLPVHVAASWCITIGNAMHFIFCCINNNTTDLFGLDVLGVSRLLIILQELYFTKITVALPVVIKDI